MGTLRLIWDQDNSAFLQRPEEELSAALAHCQPDKPCVSCGMKAKAKAKERWTVSEEGSLVQGDVHYHLQDVVYIRPLLDDTDVYILGQIVDIYPAKAEGQDPMVDVRIFQRVDLVARRQNKHFFGNHKYNEV